MNIQYCCQGFKGLIERAGERGASVIVVRMFKNQLKFRLQSRGIAHRDAANFRKIAIPIEVNILLTVTIAYCPYCGRRLEELLDATPAEYAALATKHESLNTVPET
jgi:hypothetical protein